MSLRGHQRHDLVGFTVANRELFRKQIFSQCGRHSTCRTGLRVEYQVSDAQIIRPLENPIAPDLSIAILNGSLAPDCAVVKLGIPDGKRPEFFQGKARVCHDSDTAVRDNRDGTVKAGDVVILWGQ